MAKERYAVKYAQVDGEQGSASFGYLIEKVIKFRSFREAHDFCRAVMTTPSCRGRPEIEDLSIEVGE